MISAKTSALLLCAALAVSLQAYAQERGKALKGVYRGTRHGICMESRAGFGEATNPVFVSDGNRYADTFTSTIVFSGTGTAIETAKGTTSFLNGAGFPGAPSEGTFDDVCRYAIQQQGNSFTWKGNCAGVLPTGPAAGLNVSVIDLDGEGQIAEDGSMILFGGTQPDANSLALTDASGNLVYSASRLCTGTGVLMRVTQ